MIKRNLSIRTTALTYNFHQPLIILDLDRGFFLLPPKLEAALGMRGQRI